jgi:hypothetical protein
MKMGLTECSKTSVHKIQTPGNHPKEGIQGCRERYTGPKCTVTSQHQMTLKYLVKSSSFLEGHYVVTFDPGKVFCWNLYL